jgi:HSP20 family protein
MDDNKRKATPDVCSYINEKNDALHMEVSLPGVRKEDIHLKLKDDSFYLTAPREDLEYVTTGTFCCPMDVNHTDAKYENGLLKIEVPFKDPMAEAVSVTVH